MSLRNYVETFFSDKIFAHKQKLNKFTKRRRTNDHLIRKNVTFILIYVNECVSKTNGIFESVWRRLFSVLPSVGCLHRDIIVCDRSRHQSVFLFLLYALKSGSLLSESNIKSPSCWSCYCFRVETT